MQTYKHKSSRNNHGVYAQSLFYKDPSFQATKLSTLNDQINLRLDLTIERKKSNKHEDGSELTSKTNKRKINESTNEAKGEQMNEQNDMKINEITQSEEDTTGDDEEDDEMPIEELGRNYLSRYNNLRRHTISNYAENINTNLNTVNHVIKSTEFYMINGMNKESNEKDYDDDENEEEQPKQKRLSSFNHSNFNLNIASSFSDVQNLNKSPNASFRLNNNESGIEISESNEYFSTTNWSPPSLSQPQKKCQYQLPVGHGSHNSHHNHNKHHRHHHSNYHGLKPQRNKNRSIFFLYCFISNLVFQKYSPDEVFFLRISLFNDF